MDFPSPTLNLPTFLNLLKSNISHFNSIGSFSTFVGKSNKFLSSDFRIISGTDLEPAETRAIFKNVSVELRMYKKLKLFLHAEGVQIKPQSQNNEIKAIVRICSDLNENYYQIGKLLTISDYRVTTGL